MPNSNCCPEVTHLPIVDLINLSIRFLLFLDTSNLYRKEYIGHLAALSQAEDWPMAACSADTPAPPTTALLTRPHCSRWMKTRKLRKHGGCDNLSCKNSYVCLLCELYCYCCCVLEGLLRHCGVGLCENWKSSFVGRLILVCTNKKSS